MNNRIEIPLTQEAIVAGLQATSRKLIEESRRTGKPLLVGIDGKPAWVDADGQVLDLPLPGHPDFPALAKTWQQDR